MVNFFDSVDGESSVFKNLRQLPKFADGRNYIESLWTKYEPFAPKDFREKCAKSTCNQILSFLWEMSLGVQLLDSGYALLTKDLPNTDRPDICIDINGQRVWIECCMPKEPNMPAFTDHANYSWGSFHSVGRSVEELSKPSILCITNALCEKKKQYDKWYAKKILKDTDIFIVAINGANLDLGLDLFGPSFLSGCYPAGDTIIDSITKISSYVWRSSLRKDNGSLVSQEFFLDPANSAINGMLYTNNLPPFICSKNSELVLINNVKSSVNPAALLQSIPTVIYEATSKNNDTEIQIKKTK